MQITPWNLVIMIEVVLVVALITFVTIYAIRSRHYIVKEKKIGERKVREKR